MANSNKQESAGEGVNMQQQLQIKNIFRYSLCVKVTLFKSKPAPITQSANTSGLLSW